jgi:hypothetical protein
MVNRSLSSHAPDEYRAADSRQDGDDDLDQLLPSFFLHNKGI